MARERLRKEAREFMATYIAHYQSPKGSYERERGLFEFESDARAGTKANAHDARMKMLELFGALHLPDGPRHRAGAEQL